MWGEERQQWPVDSRPNRCRRVAGAVVSVVLVLVGLFAVGNLVGRAVFAPEPTPARALAETLPPTPAPATTPPAPVRSSPPAAEEPAGTGGRLPLNGTGPYGTSRVTGARFVALTFDDGPDPRWTPQVLELLRRHRVTATFCLLGEAAAAHPELVRAIVADGHTLCNHSWAHDLQLGSRPVNVIRADLERTNAAIRAAVPDATIAYYRQPGGVWTERVIGVATELGLSPLHWAVDPQDWRRPAARVIAEQLVASPPGAIVLLHDGGGDRRPTVDALRQTLPKLVDRHELAALPPNGRARPDL